MSNHSVSMGKIPFEVPGVNQTCQTWYNVLGDLETPSHVPLITLHGGPGACYEYLSPLEDLYNQYQVPVVFYDQIGNGNSTRLPEKAGDEKFWSVDLFIAELDNLIEHFDLRNKGFNIYGHSWGGMLAASYAARRPKGLQKVVIAAAPASIELHRKGLNQLKKTLPQDVQDTIDRCESEGQENSTEYENAAMEFYKRYLCRLDPWPKDVEAAIGHMGSDPTVYGTMWGKSELDVTGSLRSWTALGDAHQIDVPTFVINAQYDEMQDESVQPFFQLIPRVRWVSLDGASHMAHWEKRARYMELVGQFLTEK